MRPRALIAAVSVMSLLLPATAVARGEIRSGKEAKSTAKGSQASAQGVRFAKVTNLIGMGLQDEQGDGIGEIENLMIDLTSGRITYAILEVGGWLDIGDKHLAAPWKATNSSTMRVIVLSSAARSPVSSSCAIKTRREGSSASLRRDRGRQL